MRSKFAVSTVSCHAARMRSIQTTPGTTTQIKCCSSGVAIRRFLLDAAHARSMTTWDAR
jgi:hypothetical protein